MRTALSQFSFALVVLKIFTSEFYPIGALLACFGAAVMLVAVYRRYEGNRQFFDCEETENVPSHSSSSSPSSPPFSGSSGEEEHEGRGEGVGNGEGPVDGGRVRARLGRIFEMGSGTRSRTTTRTARRRSSQVVVVKNKFRTSGNSVGMLVGLSLVSYVALIVLIWELGS